MDEAMDGMAAADGLPARRRAVVGGWLLALCAMVLVMVVIGGLTRLTHSGLSMVEWKPITGWLPPLSDEAWRDAFRKYQGFPEYKALNHGMTLAEFQSIFWLEYLHRLWGRIIGLAFLVPVAFFAWKRWVRGALAAKLAFIFALGAGQGALGWYMVMSGLVDLPDVSPYRLTAHLALALAVEAAMLWIALDLLLPRVSGDAAGGAAAEAPCVLASSVALLVFVTALSGGLVAGLDAGFVHNTFPLMDGELLPAALYDMNPPYLSAFEDVTTVQFNHRWLALATLTFAWGLWWRARRAKLARVQRLAVVATAALATVQVALGILTLVLAVPLALAAAHQGNAVLALSAAVAAAHQLRGRPASGGG